MTKKQSEYLTSYKIVAEKNPGKNVINVVVDTIQRLWNDNKFLTTSEYDKAINTIYQSLIN